MPKKYNLDEAKHKVRKAKYLIYPDFQRKKEYFERAAKGSAEAVQYIEGAIAHYRGTNQTTHCSEWQNLLCEASFGKGLTDGLLEMKNKTYRTRYRPIRELESVVQEISNAFADLAREPLCPENHLRVGFGLGRLGMVNEGEKLFAKSLYWNNINDYLAKK